MNKKLIAAAVSAAVVAPVAVADVTVYGNITNAIKFDSPDTEGADSSTNLATLGSRFGVKASSDLGNGMTANGRLELGLVSDDNNGSDPFDKTRIATVGLSGGFGSVTLGQQWSSYFNTFGTLVSPTYTVGHAAGPNIFRTGNTIKYGNSFGPVSLEADLRLNEGDGSEAQDRGGYGIGFSFSPIDNLTIAVAHDNADNAYNRAAANAMTLADVRDGYLGGLTGADPNVWITEINAEITARKAAVNDVTDEEAANYPVTFAGLQDAVAEAEAALEEAMAYQTEYDATPEADRLAVDDIAVPAVSALTDDVQNTGLSIKYDFGPVAAALGFQNTEQGDLETDGQVLLLSGKFSEKTSWLLGYAEAEDQDDVEAKSTTWGVYHSLGGGITLLYEARDNDNDGADSGGSVHWLAMRLNF